jgi:transposase
MHGKDYNKQIARRQRIKKTTLVIGLDVGCEFNALCLMNKEGEVLGKYPRIYNSRKGFDYFLKVVEETKAKKGCRSVLIGLEPTGHYWRKIAYFAQAKGYEVRFVRTTALRHQRELDESSSAKSDVRDAVTIANITREGKYLDTVIEDALWRQRRTLSHVRERIQRYNTGSKHALQAVLEDYFPEWKGLFWSMKSKGLWALLENCPFPEEVLRMGIKKLTDLIARSTRRSKKAQDKAAQVYQAAQESVGLKSVGISDRYRMRMYLQEVKHSEEQLKDLEARMRELLQGVPCAAYLLSVPGIGIVSCAVFLGELGNPSHFTGPKQIIKYAGYDPQENDSGQRIGRKVISKKGRWLLRKYLYFMSMRAIHRSEFFREYYQRKVKSRNRFGQPLGKKEALCAVAIKLIKVLFALLRDKRAFSVKAPGLALAA